MKNRKLLTVLLVVILMFVSAACAETAISTTMVMRVSRMTQNAIVNAGEDFTMDVSVNGVNPSSYQWYYEDELIEGADQKILNIVSAAPEDSGVYRMDAFDQDGTLLVSMESLVRVLDNSIPQSGDTSVPPMTVVMIMLAAAVVMTGTLLKRRAA